MRMNVGTAIAAMAISLCGVAWADEPAQPLMQPLVRPDRTTIGTPDMAFTPTSGDIDDYDDYFYFYKAGVSYETAFTDLDQCRIYALSTRIVPIAPNFVPLESDTPKNDEMDKVAAGAWRQYGLVGLVIAGWIVADAEDEAARGTMRRCMMYKGYARYGTTKAIWRQIETGSDADKIARRAILASGLQPSGQAIAP